MYPYDSSANLIIQGCIAVVIIGVFYNLMVTTKAYGGIIGKALRFIGIGILFFSLSAIEHALVNFAIIKPAMTFAIVQDSMTLIGLIFLGFGFSKLASASKA